MRCGPQAALQPALFTEVARADLRDTLLHQRPLRPVRPGRCTLLPDEERAPLALPSTQRFRILQEVNHLRLLDEHAARGAADAGPARCGGGGAGGKSKLSFDGRFASC
jgi:CRISPR-associated endonuclease Csn1